VLGYREQQERPLIDTLAEQLRAVELVLAVDNCEHVLDAAGALIVGLLAAVPELRVLCTSREPLGAPGEVTCVAGNAVCTWAGGVG
jgi:predicted ATPase